MKRTLLLLLLSVSTLWGQFLPDIPDRLSYAAQLNGSSQYFSKTSPVNMDLNGSELLSDVGFESGRWTAVFNATTSQSTVQKRTGTYSMLVLATGGSATTRSPAVTNATTNKFTGEAWVYVPNTNTSKTVRLSITDQGASVINPLTTVSPATDTWVKVVVNVQAPGTQTGLTLQVGLSGTSVSGDSLYIDDVSLTQAYDGLIGLWFYASSIASNLRLVGRTTAGNNAGFEVFTNSSKFTGFSQAGPAFTGNAQSQTLTSGRWHFGVAVINRTDSIRVSANGEILTGAVVATSLGKIVPGTVFIGSLSGTSQFWAGNIGELVYVRYTSSPSVAVLNAWIAYANTQRFIPEPPGGGTTVLRLFGKENSAYDQSGIQGVLTNTGNTPIIPR